MNVLALTIFVGFILVTLFALLWLLQACQHQGCSDREALLPLEDDAPLSPDSSHLPKS